MIALPPSFRYATIGDAEAMTVFVNLAGEGLPLYLWSRMASADQSPWDVGRQRAQREHGAFSWRNTVLADVDGEPAAALIGYPLAMDVETADYEELPPMFVPLQQLEDLAPGSWYVNVLATVPERRGAGLGSALLGIAEQLAAEAGRAALSIIVSDANHGARRLYQRNGYVETASRPMVKEEWRNPGEHWLLLVKSLRGEAVSEPA